MQFGFSRKKTARSARQDSHHRPLKRRRLSNDHLEDRRLLTAGTLDTTPAWTVAPAAGESGSQYINDANVIMAPGGGYNFFFGQTQQRSVASFGNGTSVVAWADQLTDGNFNLMLQPYDAAGSAIGTATTVATEISTPGIIVAAQQTSAPGDFVAVWSSVVTTKKGTVPIYDAQVYDLSSGALAPVGSASSSGGAPTAVAMDAAGNFDVLYGGSVQRYNSSAVAQGAPITVNGAPQLQVSGFSTVGTQAIAMDANGDFAISYFSKVETVSKGKNPTVDYTYYIYAEKFGPTGTPSPQGLITVATGVENGDPLDNSNVAMDAAGDFVVAWEEHYANFQTLDASVYASVFYAGGGGTGPIDEVPLSLGTAPDGATITYNAANHSMATAVVMQPNGGGAFDLAWEGRYSVLDGNGNPVAIQNDIYAEPFDSSGKPAINTSGTTGPITVNELGGVSLGFNAAIDANNDLLVDYLPAAGLSGSSGVFAELFKDPPAASGRSANSSSVLSPASRPSPSGPTTAMPWKIADTAPPAAIEYSLVDDATLNALVKGHTARGLVAQFPAANAKHE